MTMKKKMPSNNSLFTKIYHTKKLLRVLRTMTSAFAFLSFRTLLSPPSFTSFSFLVVNCCTFTFVIENASFFFCFKLFKKRKTGRHDHVQAGGPSPGEVQ